MYKDKFIKGYLRFSTVFLSRLEAVHTFITPSPIEIPCRVKLRKCTGYGVQLVILRGGRDWGTIINDIDGRTHVGSFTGFWGYQLREANRHLQ